FNAAQRANVPSSGQTFRVLVDGAIVGTFNNLTTAGYAALNTTTFTVSAGVHTVAFQATNLAGGDNTVFIDQVGAVTQVASLDDSGFEAPALAPGEFRYNPTGSPWAFTGTAGVTTNVNAFTSGNPLAPQGSQVAFIQRLGSASQTATFVQGTYVINFAAAQRGNLASAETFSVLVDGTAVGTFNAI